MPKPGPRTTYRYSPELKALRQIKKDYERLKVEHDLLKKSIAFTSARKATSSPSSSTTRKRTR